MNEGDCQLEIGIGISVWERRRAREQVLDYAQRESPQVQATRVRRGLTLAVVCCLCLSAIGLHVLTSNAYAQAVAGERTTRAEMALLPEYCPHAAMYRPIYGSQEGFNYWRQRLGYDFTHLHHYCWALVALQRARRASVTAAQEKSWLASAEADISYVIRFGSPQFVLMPEMYLRRGQVRLKLKKEREALDDFQRSSSLKPDYWPPYVEMATVLESKGDVATAKKVLEDGLKHAPDAKALQAALQRLSAQ